MVTFLPDDTIFEETVFDFDTLKTRLRETAFLTKGLRITLKDLRGEEKVEKTFHYEGGIKEFVQYLNRSKTELYPDIYLLRGESRTGCWWRLPSSTMIPIRKILTAL